MCNLLSEDSAAGAQCKRQQRFLFGLSLHQEGGDVAAESVTKEIKGGAAASAISEIKVAQLLGL